MSRINSVKTRLSDMFLRDRGSIDEVTAEMLKSDVRDTLERYLIVSDFAAEFAPSEGGEVSVCIRCAGRRARNNG